MNIHEYISSGIIESYVLGLASPEERLEFEQHCARHPELLKARNDFEIALETRLNQDAVIPPVQLKESIFNSLRNVNNPAQKVIRMDTSSSVQGRVAGFRWMAAASVILFLIAGVFAFKFYNENKELKVQLRNTREAQAQISDRIRQMEDERKLMTDKDVAVVNLVGTQKGNPSSAMVYWDSTSANVYMVVKNMPVLPSEKQYQLWALIEGKPVDLGLFDGGQEKVILKMNNTQKADAFAITIEKRGNTGSPAGPLESTGKTKL